MSPHKFDALIITALLDELEPVLTFGEAGKDEWATERDPDGFPFHFRDLPRADGRAPLRIAAASFEAMGGVVTAARATALIKYLDPACLAMCGICAGKRKDVALGDVIVADRVYSYDYGKLVAKRNGDGHRIEDFYHDIRTYNLEATWRVDAAYFARELGWTTEFAKKRPLSMEAQRNWLLRELLRHEQEGAAMPDDHPDRDTYCPMFGEAWDRLRQLGLLVDQRGVLALTDKGRAEAIELKRRHKKELPKDRGFKIHVGAIGTGNAVQKDDELFNRLEKLVRKTLGAEMEAAAIGLVAEQLNRKSIIVKAVSDYGDSDKDDAFREFATQGSAQVLMRFLLRNLEPSDWEWGASDAEQPTLVELPFPRMEFSRGDDLLSRVAKVAELRVKASGATAEVRRISARPPLGGYLRVSRIEKPFSSVFPVAAVDQITADVFKAFVVDIDAHYRRDDKGVRSTLVYGGPPPSDEIKAD